MGIENIVKITCDSCSEDIEDNYYILKWIREDQWIRDHHSLIGQLETTTYLCDECLKEYANDK